MIKNILFSIDSFIDNKFTKTKFGNAFMYIVRSFGISQRIRKIPVNRILDKEAANPTQEMREEKAFFEANKSRVDAVCNMLANEESRQTYLKAIEFRITHNRKIAPKYTPEKWQYFDKEIVNLSNEEVFIDCGAFYGDTVDNFVKQTKNQYKRIVCFEPDENNCEMIQAKKLHDVKVYCAGVWDKCTRVAFVSDGGKGARVVENADEGNTSINVVSIDSIEDCKGATYIKMDIEGSEMNALIGAKETIVCNKPKLAICIYHSDEDFLRIPEYIKSLVPEYKLYVKHYSYEVFETVLYAIV